MRTQRTRWKDFRGERAEVRTRSKKHKLRRKHSLNFVSLSAGGSRNATLWNRIPASAKMKTNVKEGRRSVINRRRIRVHLVCCSSLVPRSRILHCRTNSSVSNVGFARGVFEVQRWALAAREMHPIHLVAGCCFSDDAECYRKTGFCFEYSSDLSVAFAPQSVCSPFAGDHRPK